MAELYDYEADDGTVYEGLSIVDALKLKQEDEERAKRQKELQEQQASDAKLGPQIAAGIHAYEAQQQQNSKGPQQPFQAMGNTSSSPMSAMSSSGPSQNTNPAPNVTISRFGEDGFMESVNSAVEQQKKETPSPFDGTPSFDSLTNNASASPMSAMQDTSGMPSWTPDKNGNMPQSYYQNQQASKDYAALTKGIPPEAMEQLHARWRMGEFGKNPSTYYAELLKTRGIFDKARAENEKEEFKAKLKGDSGYSAANNFGARKQWDNPEKKAATLEKLNNLKDYLGLDDTTYGAYVNNIENGKAWDVSQAVDGLIADKLGLGYKVQQEYDLIDPRSKTAGAEQGAKAGAPRRLDKGELESLRTKRSIYDDLTSAQSKFDPKFVTPYVGKIVKISFLKQNVPGFADFVSDLERGVGKYRKDQFGASQTEGEANNLKDAINKDLDVKPEVFVKQLNNFITSLERDYTDEIEVYKSDNVKVPDIFNSIKTQKTVNPERDKPEQETVGASITQPIQIGKYTIKKVQ